MLETLDEARSVARFSCIGRQAERLSIIYALNFILLFLPASVVVVAQPQEEEKRKADSTFRGRVIYEGTDEPVRRGRVSLIRLDVLFGTAGRVEYTEDIQRTTSTDARGNFAFTKLVEGKYAVTVSAPDVISTDTGWVGRANSFDPLSDPDFYADRLLEVDGVRAVERTMRVSRGGSITGRVQYSDGEAATNVSINLFCRRKESWEKCGPVVQADDRGRYRLEGLPAGEYVVAAAENNIWALRGKQHRPEQLIFYATFHTAATSPQKAETVRVEAGRETEDIDLTFTDALRRVSGVVSLKSDGRAVAEATVRIKALEKADGREQSLPLYYRAGIAHVIPYATLALQHDNSMTQTTDEEGRWSFDNLSDGNYVVSVLATHEKVARTGNGKVGGYIDERGRSFGLYQASREITVAGGDVTGVDFQLTEGGRISGVVVFEGGEQLTTGSIYIAAMPVQRSFTQPVPQPAARADGTFEIDGLVDGEIRLDAFTVYTARDKAPKVYVKSITGPDGADMLKTPVRVSEETNIAGVRVVVASDGATLMGRVRMKDARAPVGASVYLVPLDASLWEVSGRHFSTFTDVDGGFTFECPPGDYFVFVAGRGDDAQDTNALFAAHATTSSRVTLRPNERREIEIVAPEGK